MSMSLLPRMRQAPEIHSDSKAPARAVWNGVGAAIASAIDDALRSPGAITSLPVTPARLHDYLVRQGNEHARGQNLRKSS